MKEKLPNIQYQISNSCAGVAAFTALLLLTANILSFFLILTNLDHPDDRVINNFDPQYQTFDESKESPAAVLKEIGFEDKLLGVEKVPSALNLLEQSSNLKITTGQKIKINPLSLEIQSILKEISDVQREILHQQDKLKTLGKRINSILEVRQRKFISDRRDEISLKRFEKPYWDFLVKSLSNLQTNVKLETGK